MKPAKARIGANSEVSREVLDLIRQAMSEMQVTQETIAINAEVQPSVVSEALNERNGRSFSVVWLWAQDDLFVQRVIELWQLKRGLTPDGIRAAKVARIKELIGLLIEVA